jgi:histidine triad (HIT) family protein
VQLIANAAQSAMGAEGTFVAMNNRVSQSVPHLHVHVVPRKKGDGLKGFFWPRTKYKSPADMAEVAKLIADRIKGS